jgi:hypothetical protein
LAAGLLLACGDAYSTHVPSQKVVTEMILLPDNSRVGQLVELHLVVFTPSESNYITNYDFGPDIDVLEFDTGAGEGCAEVVLDGITVPQLFEVTHAFPVCMTVQAQADATTGERLISIDLESSGIPLTATRTYYVLPSLTY